jgi:hypothetical protein
MSTPARKRLMRDFKRLQHDPPAGISGAPYDNDIMHWNAVIFGCVLRPCPGIPVPSPSRSVAGPANAAAVLGFSFGGPLDRPPGVSLFQLLLIVLVSELIVSCVVFAGRMIRRGTEVRRLGLISS